MEICRCESARLPRLQVGCIGGWRKCICCEEQCRLRFNPRIAKDSEELKATAAGIEILEQGGNAGHAGPGDAVREFKLSS